MMKSELTKIDYDVSSFTLKEWICSLIEIMGIVSLVNYLCYRILWLSVLGIPFGYWYIRWKKRKKKEQRRKKLELNFVLFCFFFLSWVLLDYVLVGLLIYQFLISILKGIFI